MTKAAEAAVPTMSSPWFRTFVVLDLRNPSEYATLEKTFVPGLLDDLATWMLTRTKR